MVLVGPSKGVSKTRKRKHISKELSDSEDFEVNKENYKKPKGRNECASRKGKQRGGNTIRKNKLYNSTIDNTTSPSIQV